MAQAEVLAVLVVSAVLEVLAVLEVPVGAQEVPVGAREATACSYRLTRSHRLGSCSHTCSCPLGHRRSSCRASNSQVGPSPPNRAQDSPSSLFSGTTDTRCLPASALQE